MSQLRNNLSPKIARGCKGLQPSRSMSFFREGWPPCRPNFDFSEALEGVRSLGAALDDASLILP